MIKIKIDLWLLQFDLQIWRERKETFTINKNAINLAIKRNKERIFIPRNN